MILTTEQSDFLLKMKSKSRANDTNDFIERIIWSGTYHENDRIRIYEIIHWYIHYWIDMNQNGCEEKSKEKYMNSKGFVWDKEMKQYVYKN